MCAAIKHTVVAVSALQVDFNVYKVMFLNLHLIGPLWVPTISPIEKYV